MMKITIVNWSPLKRHYENVAVKQVLVIGIIFPQ